MKFLHISDTHLGFSAYRKSTPDGINQRELDVYKSFEQFVNYAIESKPDLVMHSGDLFDAVRPNNRAITFALKQLLKLSNSNIPCIIIAGNHEHPKLSETGHIFSIFEHLENIYPIYKGKYEKILFEIKNKKIAIHAIPQNNSKEIFKKEIDRLKTDNDADYNFLMCHGAVSGIQEFTMNEFNELMIPTEVLSKKFDYIALGHYHKYTKLADNVFYSGSVENLTFAEANEEKGFIENTIEKNQIKSKFIKIKTRPMFDSKPIKCKDLKVDQVMNEIKKTVQSIKPEGKTFRITLDEIPSHIYRNLDFNEIKKLGSKSVHYEIKTRILKDDGTKESSSSKINALMNEFKEFIDKQDIKDKKMILDLGSGYIEKIEAREEGK